MAIQTLTTDLKGNFIDVVSTTVGTNPGDDTTIVLGEFTAGTTTEVSPANRNTITIKGGKGITSSSYDSATGEITLTFSDSTTLVTGNLIGTTGTTPSISFGTVTSVANNGTASMTLATGSTDANPIFDVVLRDGPSGGVTLAALTETSVVTTARVPGYFTVQPDDNPATNPSGFPGLQIVVSTDGAAYNKFNSTTPDTARQQTLIFTTNSNDIVTSSGFQSNTPSGTDSLNRYVHWRFLNTLNLSGADIAADIASEMTADGDCIISDSTDTNGETWNWDVTNNSGVNEFRDPNGANLSGVFTVANAELGWTSANVAEVPAVTRDETIFTTNITRGSILQWTDKSSSTHIYMYTGTSTLTTADSPLVDFDTNSNFTKLSA